MTQSSGPYHDASTNAMYALLFCDDLDIYRHTVTKPWGYPWDVLLVEDPDLKELQKIVEDHVLESRIRLLAYHAMRQKGIAPKQKELLAVIVELGLEEGPDTLASFREGTARYLNYSGKILVWENADEKSRAITDQLFETCEKIVQQIGPWTKPRRPFPSKGNLRLSFLVSDGLYFGEGPINTLFSDPMAGPALQAATSLMQLITGNV